MKISALLRFLFCAFVATALSLNASAQTQSGRIKAAKVQGEVSKLSASGATTPVTEGEMLKETDTITTGKGASVVLVFENGSSVRIGADSRLAVEEFKMDPLDQALDLSALKAEPSRSKTVLNLSYGEMVGDVKKLNTSGGSSYNIKTPVGAAGIRGTIYRIVFKPSSDGKAFFTVSTAEGTVVMQGVASTADIAIAAGKEVVVEIDTDNPNNPKVVPQDIPAATIAAITAAAQEITQTLKTTEMNNTPPPTEEPKKEEPKKEEPPPPTPPAPQLTPGA